jgi:hypothetical protein
MAEQRAGCAQHLFIPALVPAEQVDAGEDWIEYAFASGERWRDQGIEKYPSTANVTV